MSKILRGFGASAALSIVGAADASVAARKAGRRRSFMRKWVEGKEPRSSVNVRCVHALPPRPRYFAAAGGPALGKRSSRVRVCQGVMEIRGAAALNVERARQLSFQQL